MDYFLPTEKKDNNNDFATMNDETSKNKLQLKSSKKEVKTIYGSIAETIKT